MRLGRCVREDEYIGCLDLVTDEVQEKCQGQQSCTFHVSELGRLIQSCPTSRLSYLYVEHECVIRKKISVFLPHHHLRSVKLPKLEVEFLGWVWVQTSSDFLTATSVTVYLFMWISGEKLRLVAIRKLLLVFMFSSCGCKKIAGSPNSNWAEELYL